MAAVPDESCVLGEGEIAKEDMVQIFQETLSGGSGAGRSRRVSADLDDTLAFELRLHFF